MHYEQHNVAHCNGTALLDVAQKDLSHTLQRLQLGYLTASSSLCVVQIGSLARALCCVRAPLLLQILCIHSAARSTCAQPHAGAASFTSASRAAAS